MKEKAEVTVRKDKQEEDWDRRQEELEMEESQGRENKQEQGADRMQVGAVSRLAGVSVRTLRYYDEIGLLQPNELTESGYRLYGEADLQRLQHILFYRELGLPLEEIKAILDHPSFDRLEALRAHLELMEMEHVRLGRIVHVLKETITQEEYEGGRKMSKQRECWEAFDRQAVEDQKQRYAEEARAKYGTSEAWAESEKKTSRYGAEAWAGIMERWADLYRRLAERMNAGAPADDPIVQETVGELRQHITDNFYNCTLEIFRGLGELYTVDERFTATIDAHGEGLAAYLRDAMHAYCDAQEGKA